jgi:acyl-CoA thioester hydrolase
MATYSIWGFDGGIVVGFEENAAMAADTSDVVRIPIRWRDVDALGHVNNAVYLTYLEELLAVFLGPVLGDDYVTARVELDFRNEVRLGEPEVRGSALVERVGASSVTVAATLSRADGEVALESRLVLVAWDREGRCSRPLTKSERQALEAKGARS